MDSYTLSDLNVLQLVYVLVVWWDMSYHCQLHFHCHIHRVQCYRLWQFCFILISKTYTSYPSNYIFCPGNTQDKPGSAHHSHKYSPFATCIKFLGILGIYITYCAKYMGFLPVNTSAGVLPVLGLKQRFIMYAEAFMA